MRIAAVLALLALGGCNVERAVLSSARDAAVDVTTCDQAFAAAAGSSCALADVCVRRGVSDPVCCRDLAFCSDGLLRRTEECEELCAPCELDRQCPIGEAICDGTRCRPCPDTATCPACPEGWARLERNGCATCDCAPPSECVVPDGCEAPQVCYVGSVCARGCDDPLRCCANVCAAADPPCARPAPLGCEMRCPAELGCASCAAAACACEAGTWRCRAQCAGGSPACFVP